MKRRQFVKGLAVGAGLVLANPQTVLATPQGVDGAGAAAVPPEAGPTLLPSGQVLAPGVSPAAADAPAPMWLFAPLSLGDEVANGWSLAGVASVTYGGFAIELSSGLKRARVSACRLAEVGPKGLAHTERVDLLLANSGAGCAATDESLAKAVVALAMLMGANEDDRVDDLSLMTFDERVMRFGPGVIL